MHFQKDILNNLSFEVDKGSILGFKGNSGVGKSTLFYILMGFLKYIWESVRKTELMYVQRNTEPIINR